jgi:hypothetical protein
LILNDDQELEEVLKTGLPSSNHASDHLPLGVTVEPNGPPSSTAPQEEKTVELVAPENADELLMKLD